MSVYLLVILSFKCLILCIAYLQLMKILMLLINHINQMWLIKTTFWLTTLIKLLIKLQVSTLINPSHFYPVNLLQKVSDNIKNYFRYTCDESSWPYPRSHYWLLKLWNYMAVNKIAWKFFSFKIDWEPFFKIYKMVTIIRDF